jgi:hypothetical protein
MANVNRNIRKYKPNDPYYFEVDNIPIYQLEQNDIILENQLFSLSSTLSNFYATVKDVDAVSAVLSEGIQESMKLENWGYLDSQDLFGENPPPENTIYTITQVEDEIDSQVESKILKQGSTFNRNGRVLDEYIKKTEVDLIDGITPDMLDALTEANGFSDVNPFSTKDDLDSVLSQNERDAVENATNKSVNNPLLTYVDSESFRTFPINHFYATLPNKTIRYAIEVDGTDTTTKFVMVVLLGEDRQKNEVNFYTDATSPDPFINIIDDSTGFGSQYSNLTAHLIVPIFEYSNGKAVVYAENPNNDDAVELHFYGVGGII